MTIFGDLQQQYGQWRQSRDDYRLASIQFIHAFARRFREYLGAPESYQTMGGAFEREPYVRVVAVKQTGEFTIEFTHTNSPFEILDQQDDGFWRSGIKLVLDRGMNEFPKAKFFYLIKFVLRGNRCEMVFMNNEKSSFSFSVQDSTEEVNVFEYMHGLVEDALSKEPWETTEKQTIGFLRWKPD